MIIAYLCLITPTLLMLAFLESKSRTVYGYMIVGITVALIASQVNTVILSLTGLDYLYTTMNLTPISEEILKALPVLFFAFAVSDDREHIVSVAFAVGIGFALLENLTMLLRTSSDNTLWIFTRGIGAGLMHGICTGAIGWGITLVKKKKLILVPGIFAVIIFSVLFHSIFNILVQSDKYWGLGIILPTAAYIPFVTIYIKQRKKRRALKAKTS